MAIPQRLSFVTLGAHDVANLRRYYRAIGWIENQGASDSFASFDCGSVKLALYPIDLLRREAAPDTELPRAGAWNGVALSVNFADRAQVEQAYSAAVACGAAEVEAPTEHDWGGCSGYIADPEGNRWELACVPGLDNL